MLNRGRPNFGQSFGFSAEYWEMRTSGRHLVLAESSRPTFSTHLVSVWLEL